MRLTRRRAAVAAALLVGPVLVSLAGSGLAQEAADDGPTSFSGTASALATRITFRFEGFPVTDIPVDGGGPTAQAALDSLGTTSGYAAFPDPGTFLAGAPSLVTGLVSSGVAGLPGIQLPPLPNFPLSVSSDNTRSEQTIGAGPYALSAKSSDRASTAESTAGLATPGGNVALLRSSASVAREGDSVVSHATTTLEGLTLGPLTIGKVTSTARYELDASGTTTSSTDLRISGARIGGVSVDLTPQGLDVAGIVIPIPIEDTLGALLGAAGITVDFLAPQELADRVIAPALRLTIPYESPQPIPGIGAVKGDIAITVGAATAEMSGVPFAGDTGTDGSIDLGGTDDLSGGVSTPDLGSGGVDLPDLAPVPRVPGSGGQPVDVPVVNTAVREVLELDLRSLYLVVGAGALTTLAISRLIRRMGVWT